MTHDSLGATPRQDETQSPLIPDPGIPGRASRHNPALDGMRGVAILLVLLFHGFLSVAWKIPSNVSFAMWPNIGWLGVDIFFVLSGFLITGILLDTRNSPRHFRNFYARRFLRIIPVYYLFLAVIFLVLPLFGMFNTEGLKVIQHRQAWLWTHLTNIGFVYYHKVWVQADWLDLNHLWSLAIEEQFYVLWPLLVYFLNRRWLKVTCLAFIVLSTALRFTLWQMGQPVGALYFPTPCRLDGLAMGSLVAVLVREKGGSAALIAPARVLCAMAFILLISLGLLRGGIMLADKPTVVFGVSLASLLTASLIVIINQPRPGRLLVRALNNSFLRATGKFSYGLYLFHNPLIAPIQKLIPSTSIVKAVGSELFGNVIFIGIYIAASYALALLSWYAYERHWLKLKTRFDYRSEGSPSRRVLGLV